MYSEIWSAHSGDFLFSPFKKETSSFKSEIAYTSIPGITLASFAFSYGINILLKPASFAAIVVGSTDDTFLSFPSRESSHKKILSFKKLH